MADMANKASRNPFIYDRLSFLDYDCIVLVWTPSGSCPLCLTPPCYQLQKPPETAALFCASYRLETINPVAAGLFGAPAQ
ncbi:peptide synthetase [Bradyrhizobium elkanii USDA 61]|nr:peptide synthetase [Bradyrhizobium elkanii USDA 61]